MFSCQNTSLFSKRNVSINLGDVDRAVPQHFLNIADIYISFQQTCCKSMSEHMGGNVLSNCCNGSIFIYHSADSLICQGTATLVSKKVVAIGYLRIKSSLYLLSILITEVFPIWIRRSLLPLPYIRMLPSYRLISLTFSAQSSEIRMPVANKSSITAASLREFLLW